VNDALSHGQDAVILYCSKVTDLEAKRYRTLPLYKMHVYHTESVVLGQCSMIPFFLFFLVQERIKSG